MNNIRILARNLADTATVTTDAAMVATLPIANVQKPTERARTARTTTTGDWNIYLTNAAQQTGNMAALTRNNFSSAGLVRPILYSDVLITATYIPSDAAAFVTTGLDTAVDVYTEADFKGMRSSVVYFAQRSDIRAMWWRTSDAANADGYLEATRLWFGKYFQFQYDPPYGGIDMVPMDASVAERAADGTHIVDRKWRARKIVLRLDFIPDTDLPSVLAIARYLGKNGECWLDCYPDDTGAKGIYHRGAFRLTDSPTFNPYQVGLHKNTMTFEET